MHDVTLAGCTPEPLMGYLKSLGLLRLVGEQVAEGQGAAVRGVWCAGTFVLRSPLDLDGLVAFFLDRYQPTPIVAPWAGGSGFFGKDNREAVDAIAASPGDRMAAYRAVIAQVREILRDEGQSDKPSDEAKAWLLRRYRNTLPEAFVTWIDAALVIQGEGQSYPPLLGTGGNDGRLDFTQNFMQRLVEVGLAGSKPNPASAGWLRQALTSVPTPGLIPAAVGQFDPGRAGGPNATQGMEGDALVNPWDFILMLEGTLLLAGSATRRLGATGRERASFPFTTRRASPVGFGSASEQEGASARGEIWLPLWERFASLAEIREVFSQGRADVSGRYARDGVDFARAVAGLGTDRGISGFVRYGFLKRSGKSYVAAPLGYFAAPSPNRREVGHVDLLRELDGWLDTFRRAAQADDAPPRFATAARRIDAAIFDYCRQVHHPSRMAALLRALGHAERELAGGERFRKNDLRTIPPVPKLSPTWLHACNDGSAEFCLARALASMQDTPIRHNLEPVTSDKSWWEWAEVSPGVVWSRADLATNLTAVLTRRLLDDRRRSRDEMKDTDKGVTRCLGGRVAATHSDLAAFLRKETDDRKIEELLWGMVLIDDDLSMAGDQERAPEGSSSLPRTYALLKLLYLPTPLIRQEAGRSIEVEIKTEPAILGRLHAGDRAGACRIASRRLVASGLIPFGGSLLDGKPRPLTFHWYDISDARLAASLLFPVAHPDQLASLVLRPEKLERT